MENKESSFLQSDLNLNVPDNDAVNKDVARMNEEAKIKEILAEQQKLQQLYNQVVAYIQQHPQMQTEEMIKYQTQLKQLSEYYQANQEKLKTLGYSSVQVNRNVVIKKGARRNISVKTIFTGCGIIILFFVLGLWGLSFYLANNPETLGGFEALGVAPAAAKSILSGIALIVMIIILLLGVVILIINAYKSFTVKNKPKARYYAGMFFGLIVLGVALGAGTPLLGKVSSIDVESIANPEDVVLLNMVRYKYDDGIIVKYEKIDGSFPVIAPVDVTSQLLSSNYTSYIQTVLPGGSVVTNVQLDCGNSQIIPISANGVQFQGACFYTKKGEYPVSLVLTYQDGGNITEKSFLLRTLKVHSAVKVTGIKKKVVELEDQYSVGPLPVEVEFDANDVFTDLGLTTYDVAWDSNNDGLYDSRGTTVYRYTYDASKVYYPMVKFPGLPYLDDGGIEFTFPLRVTPSGLPVCEVEFEQIQGLQYKIVTNFLDNTRNAIGDYTVTITDKTTNKILDEIHDISHGDEYRITFPGQGGYDVKINFVTKDNQNGQCSNNILLNEKSKFTINYELSSSAATSNDYTRLDLDKIKKDNNTISVTEVPTRIKLRIISIEPNTNDKKITVSYDGAVQASLNNDEYLFTVSDSNEHTIRLNVEDSSRGLSYDESFVTKIGLDDIVGKLKIVGDTTGFEPFVVTLDASASRLNDSSDQIVYFTRDYGDGEIQNKINDGVVKHQYRFDYANNNGTFIPKVTIFTQKGRSVTVAAPSSIVVKKQVAKLDIYSTSHPLQEAKIGDTVVLGLEFNGLPKRITWDFGDGTQPYECEGRTCSEIQRSWSEKGTYLITVMVEFDDQAPVQQTMQFKIR